jgi:hypothetical protein
MSGQDAEDSSSDVEMMNLIDSQNSILFNKKSLLDHPCTTQINKRSIGKKLGIVVREEDSSPRGRGFESRRILDGCKRC